MRVWLNYCSYWNIGLQSFRPGLVGKASEYLVNGCLICSNKGAERFLQLRWQVFRKPKADFIGDSLNLGVAFATEVPQNKSQGCALMRVAGGGWLIALRTGAHAGDVLAVCEMRWDVDLVPVQCLMLTPFEAGMP